MDVTTENSSHDQSLHVARFSDAQRAAGRRLRWLHAAAALFMGIQTIAYGAVGASATVKPSVGFPTQCKGPICEPALKVLGEADPVWIIILFVALASFDHFVTFVYAYKFEESALHWLFFVRSNPFRWIEYSISASVMVVAIAILSGIHDVHLWFLLLFMTAIGMLLGFILELVTSPNFLKLPAGGQPVTSSVSPNFVGVFIYSLGSLSDFVPWMVIFCYFFKAATRSGSDVPDFVYAAFLGTFVLFLTFGTNSFCCHIWRLYDFETAEKIYILLSFTAKTFLAADVFGGLNAQSDD